MINLTKISETNTSITLGWAKVPGAIGYKYNVDGKISHTWDGNVTTVRVSKTAKSVIVQALGIEDSGVWPVVVTTPQFTGWGIDKRPAFSAQRTINCTTPAEFFNAWTNIKEGDLLNAIGVVFNGQVNLINKRLLNWAEVHFDQNCRFLGGGSRSLNAAWVMNTGNIRFYGGDLTNPTGHGIRIEDSDISWWDFNVHDVAGGNVSAFGLGKTCNVDIRGEVSRNGGDLTLDPHSEKGTGLHGVYLGAGNYLTSGTCIIKANDLPAGAAIEVGPKTDFVCEAQANNLTFQAQYQVAGNVFQLWGSGMKLRVPYVYGENLAGRVVETDALGTADVIVEYGRSNNVRLEPRYAPKTGVIYKDCS